MIADEANRQRVQTDESLRNERKDADEVVTEMRSAERTADAVVDKARSRADAVLDQARDDADNKLGDGDADAVDEPSPNVVARERVEEDTIVLEERAQADDRLRREREEQTTILERLLLEERANTDRHLLTERDRSDDAIAHRDNFLGMVSHDLRNLLHSVNINAIYVSAKATDTEEGLRTVEGMKRIQRDVVLMSRIIEDLVDIVSIDAGKLGIRLQYGDVVALLTETADACAIAALEKGISLSTHAADAPLNASFDHHRMSQVLANCLSNAIKFTPRGGRIELRGARVGDDIQISVTDTGPGISAAKHEAVFERFWQIGENHQRGLGLGLYISKCIVTGHQGKIWVESVEGSGSTIHFTIPCGVSDGD